MPITARFLNLILVITNVQQSSSQTCSANFISVPASGSCPAERSCRTTGGCCGSCSGSSGQCFAYTFGNTCSNTPISCPANFDALPSDATGSRPRGSCPASRPYQTTTGCCGACRTTSGTVMAYNCGTYCSNTPGIGCSSTVPGTSAPPPPPSPPPPPPPSPPPPPPAPSILPNLPTITGWGVSCADFHDFSRSSPGGICTCVTTGWPFATGLKLECLAQIPSTWAVGLRMDMQVCQDPMSFTPSVLIPLAGWQQGEPGNTVHIPTVGGDRTSTKF